MIDKVCVVCGSGFRVSPSHSAQTFCSWSCKKKANSVEKKCSFCGCDFTVEKSKVAAKFCSKTCKDKSETDPSKPFSKYREKRKPKEKVKKVCVVCSKEFEVYPCRAQSAKTCSNECGYVLRGLTNSKPKVRFVCEECGKECYDHPCHAGRRTFCSNECRSKSEVYAERQAALVCGENNPMWNGGITRHSDGYVYQHSANHPRQSNGYVLQHRLVIENALREQCPGHSFLCEIDGIKFLRADVHVHHKDEDKSNNRISNLMAITPDAHRRLHSGYPPSPHEFWEPAI